MFLIRTAFWLALVVLLLPSDKEQQAKLYSTAREAVHRVATFCDRNGPLCEQGARHWAAFQTKLEFGSRLAIDLVSEKLTGVPTSGPQQAVDRGTLTPSDKNPPWRGGTSRTGA